ncbi:MAG: YegS/Rv2252/BmrU family lipid kinase [Lachnospiraceae bacterium]|nr:YegS/Rv2252/BmrU family lipid kinase [Candidatus Colinaster equi]
MKKMLFIYNPHSGRGQIKVHLLDMIDVFVKNGYEVVAYPTQYSGDAKRAVIERDSSIGMIVCSGGDGTLDEVVTGMMQCEKRIPIGYVPAGSTNDFARSLGIPRSMPKAAEVAMRGRDFACDIGRFNDDVFVYVAAFGMFTDVSYDTNQQLKNVLGHMAYIIEGAKRLPITTSYHYKVEYEYEGEQFTLEDDFLLGMVTNSKSVGGFKNITGKHVKLDDGVFEVTLVRKPKTIIELMEISDAIDSREVDLNMMVSFKAKSITFIGKKKVAWTLDGEFGGKHKTVNITNENKALTIMVP